MPTTAARAGLRRAAPPACFALALALLCVFAAVGGAELTGVYFFPLLSIWASGLLFYCGLAALRIAGVRLETFHWAVLAAVYIAGAVFICLETAGRSFIYIWDYSNYTLLQYAAEEAFAAGPLAGVLHLLGTLTEDYTSFICLFTEFPFCLSARTGDSFVVSQAVSVWPSLLLMLSGLVVKAGQVLRVKNERGFFLIGLTLTACFPYLRMAAALGQPDWFGLIFAFMIVTLTLDFRFDEPAPGRCVALFLATAALVLTRRWYLYFIVSYYLVYAVTVLAGCVLLTRRGEGRRAADRLRRLVTFGAGSLAAMIILLWPVVQHIVAYSYAEHYAAYNVGGLALELYAQSMRLGVLYILLLAGGLVYACRRGRTAIAGQALAVLALSILLFTRVQNMGSHQTLLLMPGYFILMLLGAAALAETLAAHRRLKLGFWLFTACISMTVRMSPLTTVTVPDFLYDFIYDHVQTETIRTFVPLDDMIYDRADIDQVRALAAWIGENCAEGEKAYMIPHSLNYCPDTFKNVGLPDRPLEDKLSFGFGILGTHPFPTDLFEAKFVITAEPFPWCYEVSDVAEKLNDAFLARSGAYFACETSFDMGNGTVFTVYRRILPTDRAEADAYLAAFAEEDAQFPSLYSEVINGWCAARGF